MKPLCVAEPALNLFGHPDTYREGQDREQIPQSLHPLAAHEMLAHQHHISGLGIGKYFLSCKIGISVLKASGQRQKGAVHEGFGHLFSLFCFMNQRHRRKTVLSF